MSEYAFKAGVYFPIEGKGMNKWNKARIVEFFDRLECVPEDYDPEDIDEEEALYFEEELNRFHPRHIYTKDTNMWIIEYIMAWDNGTDAIPEFAIDLSTLASITHTVGDILNISTRPVAFAYQWYTGTDEPFVKPLESDMCKYNMNEYNNQ